MQSDLQTPNEGGLDGEGSAAAELFKLVSRLQASLADRKANAGRAQDIEAAARLDHAVRTIIEDREGSLHGWQRA
jgi:hypothetical protein